MSSTWLLRLHQQQSTQCLRRFGHNLHAIPKFMAIWKNWAGAANPSTQRFNRESSWPCCAYECFALAPNMLKQNRRQNMARYMLKSACVLSFHFLESFLRAHTKMTWSKYNAERASASTIVPDGRSNELIFAIAFAIAAYRRLPRVYIYFLI